MGENKRDNDKAAVLEAAIRRFGKEKFPPDDFSGIRRIPQHSSDPATIYSMLRDRSRGGDRHLFDLSGYTTNHIDQYATLLAEDAVGIDLAEYPSSSYYGRIASSCADIVGGLWNIPYSAVEGTVVPVSDGERAAMLAGISALHNWRTGRRRLEKGAAEPNFVVSEGYNRIWRQFSEIFDVEMRVVPLGSGNVMPPGKCAELCDGNTIMAVGTINSHITGLDDDIAALAAALGENNRTTGYIVPLHVDATSGGFIKPFQPSRSKWDFRLPGVISISAAGHQSGLAPFPLGWVAWRDSCPISEILSETIPASGYGEAVASPFTLPALQVVAQFYQFLRLGRDGFRTVHGECMEVAGYINGRLASMPQFGVLTGSLHNPVIVFTINENYTGSAGLTIAGLQAAMEKAGWKATTYKLPHGLGNRMAMRLVIRQGTNMDIAKVLVNDIKTIVEGFENI